MQGWFKLHRCLMGKPIFDNPKLLKVFMWCLFKATYKKRETYVGAIKVELEPGQFVTGRFSAADELKMNGSTVFRYLRVLENNQTIELKPNNKFTLVNVVNWANYQVKDEEVEQQMNNKRTSNEQQMNTNKNIKNVKNEKKTLYAEFVQMTEEQYEKLLERFSEKAVKEMIVILDNYKGATGKKYKDDYRTILNWVVKRYEEEKGKIGKERVIES